MWVKSDGKASRITREASQLGLASSFLARHSGSGICFLDITSQCLGITIPHDDQSDTRTLPNWESWAPERRESVG